MSQIEAAYNGSWVCQSQNYFQTKGIFFGENPLGHPKAVILVQLSSAALFTVILQILFNPLGESGFFSQMIVGILFGPSIWGAQNALRNAIFPLRSVYVSQTFSYIGCMFFLFLVGVRTDLSMIKKSGKKAVVIGFLTFILPLCLNLIMAALIINNSSKAYDDHMKPSLEKSIYYIAACQALNSFHVVACLLADLNLLNSELGRLATSSSLVSGMCSWVSAILVFTINTNAIRGGNKQDSLLYMYLSIGSLIILVVYILRPITLWMVKQITEEKSVKEDHIFGLCLMVLSCGFFGEAIGQHMMLGPMMLGVAVPDGPPLGSALVAKLESYVSAILLPSYFVLSGSIVNVSTIRWKTVCVVESLALSGFTGKLLATMVPAIYFKMPLGDALCLGLIMTAQGITDVLMIQHALSLKLISVEAYTVMSISMVLITGITTPIIKVLYNPSKRYVSQKVRRTIQHTRPEAELRLMACIYTEDQTPSIINLLELSNPTSRNPICFYVVHLLELTGRSAPLLVTHRPGKTHYSHYSEHIVNAFRLYEQQYRGILVVNLFTAVSPYATMHDEICSLAIDKRVAMVIIPFHRQWAAHGAMDEHQLPGRPVRSANCNILHNAPCSVGILVDRGTGTISSSSLCSIGVIFVQGPDDREALAYALRMGSHPNVRLTLVRIIDASYRGTNGTTCQSDHLDDEIINEFRIAMVGEKYHTYTEEAVSDSVGTVGVIRSVENSFDLILVGRRHDNESPLFLGLTEWNEFPELGFIGDMLASSDSNCDVSVLIVQQQTFANELRGKDKFLSKDSSVILDMARNTGKVWPVIS